MGEGNRGARFIAHRFDPDRIERIVVPVAAAAGVVGLIEKQGAKAVDARLDQEAGLPLHRLRILQVDLHLLVLDADQAGAVTGRTA